MNIDLILTTLTIAVGFYMAWNIGANDVSNAMGTSVGSKALTLKRAVILAAIFEFLGAFLLGSHVSTTIQQGIVNPAIFHLDPTIFVFGMLGALVATGIWLHLASYFRLPVSTTHAIIGAVLGFGAIIGGVHAIYWSKVIIIVLSWIITPLISGIIAYFLFTLLQKKILFALNPLDATKKAIPILLFFLSLVFSFSLLFKGLISLNLTLSFFPSLGFATLLGLIISLISIFFLRKQPQLTPSKYRHAPIQDANLQKAINNLQKAKLSSTGYTYEKTSEILSEIRQLSTVVKKEVQYSKTALQYVKVENIFAILQINSACLVAFSHGANDVANAIGPVAAVLQVIKTGLIPDSFFISPKVLLIGALGIVIGLGTWGWRVIATIGNKITELTPTRGFAAEISTAFTILVASKMGLPISTTHALVGAVLGVGFAKGLRSINLKTIKEIVLSWFVTIPLCALLSIISFFILKAIFIH